MCAAGSSNPKIRKSSYEDIPRIAEINLFGWRMAYRGMLPDRLMFVERTIENTISRLREHYSEETNRTWVFVADEIVKGLLSFGLCRDEDKPEAAELYGLYTDPSFIGQGIGEEMLAYFEASEIANESPELILWTLEQNFRAQKFYERHGYIRDGGRKYLDRLQAWEIRYHKVRGA